MNRNNQPNTEVVPNELIELLRELEILIAIERTETFFTSSAWERCKTMLGTEKVSQTVQYVIECLAYHKYEDLLDRCLNVVIFSIPYDKMERKNFMYKVHSHQIPFLIKIDRTNFNDDRSINYLKDFFFLAIGIAALQLFVKANVLESDSKDDDKWSAYLPGIPKEKIKFLLGVHQGNDETDNVLYPHVRQKPLLLLSRICFSFTGCITADFPPRSRFPPTVNNCCTYKWWRLRAIMCHQRVLTEKFLCLRNTLHRGFYDIIDTENNDESNKKHWIKNNPDPQNQLAAKVLLRVEMAQMHVYYQELRHALKLIEQPKSVTQGPDFEGFEFKPENQSKPEKPIEPVCSLLGLKVNLDGAQGKRTKFQTKQVPQLYVKAEVTRNPICNLWPDQSVSFPRNLSLQDDTLLDRVEFDPTENVVPVDLHPAEQLAVFALSSLGRNTIGDRINEEEVLTYLNFLLDQPIRVWSIQLMSLVLRSKYDKNYTRRNDRAIRQMEEVIRHLREPKQHLPLIYATGFPTFWVLERELADVLLGVGAVQSALELYRKYDLWPELVHCYLEMNRLSDARDLIQEKMKVKETPRLWCLLGDVEKNLDHYHKAFELSGQKCYRSQRSLGLHHFKNKEYEKCIPFLCKSVDLNPLQIEVWFALGYAAGNTGDLTLSANAYRHMVDLDGDNFEAWNNLSHAYIGLGQKERACKTLQEALRCNYNHVRVWDNFLLVSCDVHAFAAAIRAYHRVLDLLEGGGLKPPLHAADTLVLQVLVLGVCEDLPDRRGDGAGRSRPDLLRLMGRLKGSSLARDWRLWDLYAQLLLAEDKNNPDSRPDVATAIIYQEKAVSYHPAMSPGSAVNTSADVTSLLQTAGRLASLSLQHTPAGAKKIATRQLLQKVVMLGEANKGLMSEEAEGLLKHVKHALEALIWQ